MGRAVGIPFCGWGVQVGELGEMGRSLLCNAVLWLGWMLIVE